MKANQDKAPAELAALACSPALAGLIAQLEAEAEKAEMVAAHARRWGMCDRVAKGAASAFRDAIDMARQCQATCSGIVGHWTPVTQKMPDDEITVLVWVSTLDDATLAYHCSEVLAKRGDSGWILAGHARAERVLLGVTHWCGDISPPNPEVCDCRGKTQPTDTDAK